MATTNINTAEKWVQGSDKKPQFKVTEKTTGEDLALSLFEGYGIIVWGPDDVEVGRYGYNISGFSDSEVSTVDAYTFEVALDKSLNTKVGTYKYRICVVWTDADFTDLTFETFNDNRTVLYNSVEL